MLTVGYTRNPVQNSPANRIGQFQLLDPIGSGPNGSVARAVIGSSPDQEFALKRILPELTATPFAAQALAAAARSYGNLEHPRIARMAEFGAAQGQTFTAVEFAAGVDAKRLLAEAKLSGRRIAPGSALTLVLNAARAVGYAHARGVFHLGLSPTNIIVTPDGDVKVTDFGILAATITSRPSDVPRLAHRIAYFAPEQLLCDEASPASDVFALGAIAHELVSGQRAFAGSHSRALEHAILAGAPAELRLPRPIVSVLNRCFARSQTERFADAQAFADALEGALHAAPASGAQKDLATLVNSILQESPASADRPAESQISRQGAGRRTAESAVPIPVARSMALPRIVKTTSTPPPIPALRPGAPVTDSATLLGVPISPAPKAPSTAGAEGTPRPYAVAIRPPVTPARGSSEIAPRATGKHPVTSPPSFSQEPTSQIPPELVQDLLHASLSDEALPPPSSSNNIPETEEFSLPQEEPFSLPNAHEVRLADSRRAESPPAELRSADLPPMTSRSDDLPRAHSPLFDGSSRDDSSREDSTRDDWDDAAITRGAEPAGARRNDASRTTSSRSEFGLDVSHSDLQPRGAGRLWLWGSIAALVVVGSGVGLWYARHSAAARAQTADQASRHALPGAKTTTAPATSASSAAAVSKKDRTPVVATASSAAKPAAGSAAPTATGSAAATATGSTVATVPGSAAPTATGSARPAVTSSAVPTATGSATTGSAGPVATGSAASTATNSPRPAVTSSTAPAATSSAAPAATSSTASAAPANPESLQISSTPEGARVFIDGADQGVTPIKLTGSADHHTIALLLAGYDLYLGESAGHGTLKIPLKTVTPSGGPAGIKVIRCKDKDRYYVFVDGKPTGMTCPTERIECGVGPHTVEVYDVVTENRRKWDIVVSDTRLSYRVRVD